MTGIAIRRLLSLAALVVGVAVSVATSQLFFLMLGLFVTFSVWPSRRRSRHERGGGGASFGWGSDNGGWDGGSGDGFGGDGGGGGGDGGGGGGS